MEKRHKNIGPISDEAIAKLAQTCVDKDLCFSCAASLIIASLLLHLRHELGDHEMLLRIGTIMDATMQVDLTELEMTEFTRSPDRMH